MRQGLKNIIERLNVEFEVVGSVGNGFEALKVLEGTRIDIVLTDIRMAGMDGLELLKEMRGRGWEHPVVMITGHDEFEYARTAFRLGAADYLLKPINKIEIQEVLTNLQKSLKETRLSEESSAAVPAVLPREGNEFVEALVKKIHEEYDQDLSISLLSEQAGFNASYISRIFKAATGKGFVQYLTEIRMKEAAELLKTSKMSVAEIAKSVGFWDVGHFSRTFKREFGLSPADSRKSALDEFK